MERDPELLVREGSFGGGGEARKVGEPRTDGEGLVVGIEERIGDGRGEWVLRNVGKAIDGDARSCFGCQAFRGAFRGHPLHC